MKAIIKQVDIAPDKLVVSVNCYYDIGEYGYDEWYRDVPDRPAEYEGEIVPTHKEVTSFRGLSISLPVKATLADAMTAIKIKIDGFKRADEEVSKVQSWVGTEVTFTAEKVT